MEKLSASCWCGEDAVSGDFTCRPKTRYGKQCEWAIGRLYFNMGLRLDEDAGEPYRDADHKIRNEKAKFYK